MGLGCGDEARPAYRAVPRLTSDGQPEQRLLQRRLAELAEVEITLPD